jgi:hypothetical protein
MNRVREDVIQTLMSAANSGMKSQAQGSSADEVFSAYLNLARNAVALAVEMKRDNTDILNALLGMVALLDTPGKVH